MEIEKSLGTDHKNDEEAVDSSMSYFISQEAEAI